MITVSSFIDALGRHGFRWATGVPCSYVAGPIAALTAASRYMPAANEGAALAIAAGAVAAGVRVAVFAQNSGFGNLLNPLTSLAIPYRLPVLVFTSRLIAVNNGNATVLST